MAWATPFKFKVGFPRLYVAASLKLVAELRLGQHVRGFPRLYVAASLKPLVEAMRAGQAGCFPRLYVAASLKPWRRGPGGEGAPAVFRGFMSRPH